MEILRMRNLTVNIKNALGLALITGALVASPLMAKDMQKKPGTSGIAGLHAKPSMTGMSGMSGSGAKPGMADTSGNAGMPTNRANWACTQWSYRGMGLQSGMSGMGGVSGIKGNSNWLCTQWSFTGPSRISGMAGMSGTTSRKGGLSSRKGGLSGAIEKAGKSEKSGKGWQ